MWNNILQQESLILTRDTPGSSLCPPAAVWQVFWNSFVFFGGPGEGVRRPHVCSCGSLCRSSRRESASAKRRAPLFSTWPRRTRLAELAGMIFRRWTAQIHGAKWQENRSEGQRLAGGQKLGTGAPARRLSRTQTQTQPRTRTQTWAQTRPETQTRAPAQTKTKTLRQTQARPRARTRTKTQTQTLQQTNHSPGTLAYVTSVRFTHRIRRLRIRLAFLLFLGMKQLNLSSASDAAYRRHIRS